MMMQETHHQMLTVGEPRDRGAMLRSRMVNEFNFTRPVKDPSRFGGRRTELELVKYYLDRDVSVTPVNLLIIGDRGSGKSSLLNMIDQEARRQGHLVARVDLDEGLTSAADTLLQQIVEEIVIEAKKQLDHSGSASGMVRQLHIGETNGHSSIDRKPLLSAPQRALGEIVGRLNSGTEPTPGRICIIIDDGDLIAENKVLMRRMRNAVCSAPGVQVVMAAESGRFQPTDSMASLFLRSFKFVPLSPFSRLEDVRECIEGPLNGTAGSVRVPDEFVAEVHALTGGHPYLIQLTCHVWLRRQSQGQSGSLEYHFDGDTLDELGQTADELPHSAGPEFRIRIRNWRILVRG